MFGKVITDERCMKMLNWMLIHPDEEYTGTMLAIASDAENNIDFVHRLIVLSECGILNVDSSSGEYLNITLNNDSEIVQYFKEIRKDMEYKILSSHKAIQAIDLFDFEKDMQDMVYNSLDVEYVINQVNNYENLSDEGMEGEIKKEVQKLKDEGRYEEFLEFLEMIK